MNATPKNMNPAHKPRADSLPLGTPEWVTPELLHDTIRVWQPFYQSPLSLDDAVIILSSVDRLFRILTRDDSS